MTTAGSAISLFDHFSALTDPRQAWKVLYPLPEILLLLLGATLAGADDFVEARSGARAPGLPAPVPALPARHPEPRHAGRGDRRARSRAVQGLLREPGSRACARREPDLIAIDGKTSRRSHARAKGREPLAPGLGLGEPPAAGARAGGGGRQVERDHRHPAPAGAAGARRRPGHDRRHRRADRDRRGHPGARRRLPPGPEGEPARPPSRRSRRSSPTRRRRTLDTCETTDGDHGRIEVRRHAVCHDVAWLFSDRRYPGEVAFPGLAMIGMVESETERGGKTEPRAALLPVLRQARRRHLRPRGARPLGHREPAALGPGRGLPATTSPGSAHRPRPREHGRGQAHGDEPAAPGEADHQPQEPPQARRLEHRLPREPHPADRVNRRSPDCPGRVTHGGAWWTSPVAPGLSCRMRATPIYGIPWPACEDRYRP